MDILNTKLIKAEAKEFIGKDRKWLTMALACLPLVLVNGAISGGFNFAINFSENGDVASSSFSSGSSILTWLLLPFMIGMAGYFLNHLRGLNPDWKSLYREGLDNYGKYIKVGIITDIIIFLWTLLFIIPGFVKMYQYYFVHQIMHDNPNLDHKQARNLSDRMTDGFKTDIFIMNLSFFFWILLSVFTFGIAYLYVGPYMACTEAMYYENLKHHAITSGVARPEEFGIVPIQEEPTENHTEENLEPPVLYSYIERDVETNTETVVQEQVVEEVIEVPVVEKIVEEDETNTEE